jgi:hypothetical protein
MQQVFIEGNIFDVRKDFQVNRRIDFLMTEVFFLEEINELLCQ